METALASQMRQFPVKELTLLKLIRIDDDREALLRLGESLVIQQYQPLLITPDRKVYDGNRRVEAAKLVNLESLWGVVRDLPLTVAEQLEAQFVMTEQRRGLSEQERVLACEKLQAACPELSQKQLAKIYRLDAATFNRHLCLTPDRVLPEVREAFDARLISLKAAYPISQVPLELQPELLELALQGATRDTMTAAVRQSRRKDARPATASRVRCELPGGHVVSVSGPQLSVDEVIDQLIALIKAARKARQEGLDIKTWERVLARHAQQKEST